MGFHDTRIGEFALWDLVGTLVLALVTCFFRKVPFWKSLLGWFVAGEGLHLAFGVQTEFLKYLHL